MSIIVILFAIAVFVFISGETGVESNINTETQDENISGMSFVTSTSTSHATSTNATSTDVEKISFKNAIYSGIKEPGNMVQVELAILEKGGFIVVYESSFELTGELLGVSRYLPIGEHTGIFVGFDRGVKDGEEFMIMVHEDNGDGVFKISEDPPVRDEFQNSIYTTLKIESLGKNENENVEDTTSPN